MALTLPQLGMGTWGMGGTFEKDPSSFDASVEALRFGFGLGIRLVDVAELHGEGLTESIVGEAIRGFPRKDICIMTKVSRDHLSYDGVLRAVEGSLKRLGTDYIDLYLIHKLPPGELLPCKETLLALERLLTRGMVRHIGVSNFTVPQIEKASEYLSTARIEGNEVEYNLAYQDRGDAVVPFCRANNISVIAHRPLARGLFVKTKNGILEGLALRYGKTVSQIALNWIISQGITAIPKAQSKEHLVENLGALRWQMSPEDILLLRSVNGSLPYEKIKYD